MKPRPIVEPTTRRVPATIVEPTTRRVPATIVEPTTRRVPQTKTKTVETRRAPSASTKTDVVFFGEVLWDFFEVTPSTFRRVIGGASANAAVVLARCGLRAALVGALGSDLFGDALEATLAAEGVDTRALARLPARTAITFVARGPDGEPRFTNYRAASADRLVTAAHVVQSTPQARWAVVSSSAAHPASVFLKHAHKRGALRAVDVNARPHLAASRRALRDAVAATVDGADLVKASPSDLDALVARPGDEAGALRWLRTRAPQATILLTRGAGPASAIGAHGRVDLPALSPRARVVDATGAGDAFLAGVLAVLVRRGAVPEKRAWSDAGIWTEALEVGHTLGKQAVSRVGAVTGITRLEEVRARLSSSAIQRER